LPPPSPEKAACIRDHVAGCVIKRFSYHSDDTLWREEQSQRLGVGSPQLSMAGRNATAARGLPLRSWRSLHGARTEPERNERHARDGQGSGSRPVPRAYSRRVAEMKER